MRLELQAPAPPLCQERAALRNAHTRGGLATARAGTQYDPVRAQARNTIRCAALGSTRRVFYLRSMPHPPSWPRPPSALIAARLTEPPNGARVTVAGLVILRQRPGTAKGVIFITLEDETGTVNVVVWRKLYERFRRAVIAGRMLRVTGRIQRENSVTHVLAEEIEDISPLLDKLLDPDLPSAPQNG